MAFPPPAGPPDRPSARHLSDQAAFLGVSGRQGKAENRLKPEEAGRFRDLLEDEEQHTQAAAAPFASPDLQQQNEDDADRLGKLAGEEHAEKHRSHAWPGPHPSMGLAMAAQAGALPREIAAGKPGRAEARKGTGLNPSSGDEPTGQVEDQVLQGLRRAGLTRPITGFADPRLQAGAAPRLPEWTCQQVPGARVYRWNGEGARQTLRWSEKDQLLESVGGERRQVIQKLGEQFWSETTAVADFSGGEPS